MPILDAALTLARRVNETGTFMLHIINITIHILGRSHDKYYDRAGFHEAYFHDIETL